MMWLAQFIGLFATTFSARDSAADAIQHKLVIIRLGHRRFALAQIPGLFCGRFERTSPLCGFSLCSAGSTIYALIGPDWTSLFWQAWNDLAQGHPRAARALGASMSQIRNTR